MLGHIDDLDDVCRGLKTLMADDGAFVFEVPYFGEMLDRIEYDTIYHEHLSYFAVRPLAHLFNSNGLRLEESSSIRYTAGACGARSFTVMGMSAGWPRLITRELAAGLGEISAYTALADGTRRRGIALRQRLEELQVEGTTVIGYGAPAKGTVVLNYCEIGTDLLPVVLDSTPAKQGPYVPGTHQHALPPSALLR